MTRVLIVGAGPAGCIAARMLREAGGYSITILEAGGEVGAGARTMWHGGHPYTFGPRHFLTADERVWDWMAARCPLRDCGDHQFWSYVPEDGQYYNFPLHEDDIATMPEAGAIAQEREEWATNAGDPIRHFADYWRCAVGPTLYHKLIDRYSKKMWQIPSNTALDTWTWSPKGPAIASGSRAAWSSAHSGYPLAPDGYNTFWEECVADCGLRLHSRRSFSVTPLALSAEYDIIINTAPLDAVWNNAFGRLPYVGREFLKLVLPLREALPPHVYWLYEASSEPWTRLTEFKKFTGHDSDSTLLGLEIPRVGAGRHYPLPTKAAQTQADKYLALFPRNTYSIGRHGSYRYEVQISTCVEQCFALMDHIAGGWDHPQPLERLRT